MEQANTSGSTMEVSDLIVSHLAEIGVEYVFGIPGGAVEPLYDALARSARNGGPKPVLARHEAGAAFMADGYARETGKLGVCVATSGPGTTNLITGIACAYDNGIPVLAITGQPALPSFGKRPLQESACTGINTLSMLRHCTRYNSLISHSGQIENKLVNAFMRAYQAQGPVHLSIPVDILRARTQRMTNLQDMKSLLRTPSLVDEDAVQKLCDEINQASKIVFIVGGGCGEAVEAILELANMTKAVFITTPDGKGLVNPRHRLYRGVFGFGGHGTANAVLQYQPDLILALGTSLGEWNSGAWCETILNERLVHIDASDDNLLRSPMARMHVRGRIRTVCARLIQLLRSTPTTIQRHTPPDLDNLEDMLTAPDKFTSDATPIKPQRLMRELSLHCPPTTRFLADTGNSTSWAVHYLHLKDRRLASRNKKITPIPLSTGRRERNPGWLRVTMDFAPMGWAIGAAIGVARGNPDCPVVCITGDGSYLMNGQEISVAATEKLGVLFVVLNDGALGMVKHGQRLSGAEPVAFELPPVDYRLQALSLGIPGFIINSPEDLDALDWDTILHRKGPTLLDVRVDGEEVPPMNIRMKTLKGIK